MELGFHTSRVNNLLRSIGARTAGLSIEATVVPESNVLDGINTVRRMLGRTWIDPNRCERGLEALRQYRRKWDDRLKDLKANRADVLRYFAVGFDGFESLDRARSQSSPAPA